MTDIDYNKFLKDHVSKGIKNSPTHVRMNMGSYFINDEDLNQFYKLISENIGSVQNMDSICEKPLPISLVYMDIDLKYEGSKDIKSTLFNKKELSKFIEYLYVILKDIYDEKNIDIYIGRRTKIDFVVPKNPLKSLDKEYKNYIKDGIHIYVPGLYVSYDEKFFIRKLFMDKIIENFDTIINGKLIGGDTINKIVDTTVDRSVIDRNYIIMPYMKKPNTQSSYNIVYKYDPEKKKIYKDDTLNDDSYVKLCKLSLRTAHEPTEMKKEKQKDFDIFKSTLEKKNITKEVCNIKKRAEPISSEYNAIKIKPSIKIGTVVDSLIKCLDHNRFYDYSKWYEIGTIINNISIMNPDSLTNDDAFDIFDKYSKEWGKEKYDSNSIRKHWMSMKSGFYTIGSLHYLAKIDNPVLYEETRKNDTISEILIKKGKWEHRDVLDIILPYIIGSYVCADIGEKKLYKYDYNDGRWISDVAYDALRDDMMIKLRSYVEEARIRNDQNVTSLKQKLERKQIQKEKIKEKLKEKTNTKNIETLKSQVSNKVFVDNVIGLIYFHLFDRNFENKLDKNSNLICVGNGVYDKSPDPLSQCRSSGIELNNYCYNCKIGKKCLNIKPIGLRAGKPTDMISKKTNINYLPTWKFNGLCDDCKSIKCTKCNKSYSFENYIDIDQSDDIINIDTCICMGCDCELCNLRRKCHCYGEAECAFCSKIKSLAKCGCTKRYDAKLGLRKFFQNLAPKAYDHEIKYLLDLDSKFIWGREYGDYVEKMFIFVGHGSNGKSLHHGLLENTMGSYTFRLPSSTFNKIVNNPSNAEPHKDGIFGTRIVSILEPQANKDDEYVVNSSEIKVMTSRDTMKVRGLFKTGNTNTPTWYLIQYSNVAPKIQEHDNGIWRRVELFKYRNHFMDKHEYKKYLKGNEDSVNDPYCNKKLMDNKVESFLGKTETKEAFLSILINRNIERKYCKCKKCAHIKGDVIVCKKCLNNYDDCKCSDKIYGLNTQNIINSTYKSKLYTNSLIKENEKIEIKTVINTNTNSLINNANIDTNTVTNSNSLIGGTNIDTKIIDNSLLNTSVNTSNVNTNVNTNNVDVNVNTSTVSKEKLFEIYEKYDIKCKECNSKLMDGKYEKDCLECQTYCKIPKSVRKINSNYRSKHDNIIGFKDRYLTTDKCRNTDTLTFDEIYYKYKEYCTNKTLTIKSREIFFKYLLFTIQKSKYNRHDKVLYGYKILED